MLSFDQLWVLWLLPLPLLIHWLLPAASRAGGALQLPGADALRQLIARPGGRVGGRRAIAPLLLGLLAWLLLVAAATGPRWIGDPLQAPVTGRDLLLAVDLSGSMQIEDMQLGAERVMRITAVKAVLDDFIHAREGDRIGLVLFGSRAYLQAPLTFDRQTVARLLGEAQIGFAGEETAIGDAIGLAVKRLRERPGDRHVVILLTDGANTAGEVGPVEAARVAAEQNIVIYTVGVGATELVTRGLFGTGFGSRRVNPSIDLDEDALRTIAELTGGRYFRARDPEELATIYRLLDELEPTAEETRTYRPQRALYHWPLGMALALTLGWALVAVIGQRPMRRRST